MLIERWTQNGDVRLHYVASSEADPTLVPLVFVPGGLGSAADYLQDFPEFAPRPCLAMSLRGQGRSDAPESGYAFADFVGDVAAVMAQTAETWDKVCLLGYSVAAPLAIEYTARHPERVAGLIIGDYPARYPQIPPEWIDRAMLILGRLSDRPIAEAIQRESAEVALWDRLPQITCPVLVLRGGQPGALLDAAAADRYRRLLPDARVVTFPDSGHALWEPDYQQFVTTVKTFLNGLDMARA